MAIPKDKLVIKDAGNVVKSYIDNYKKNYQPSEGSQVFKVSRDRSGGTYRDEYRYDHGEIMEGSPISTNINHCLPGMAGGMAGCAACKLKDPTMKPKAQKACDFYSKARFHTRCCYETFGEYCWSTKAQDDKKG